MEGLFCIFQKFFPEVFQPSHREEGKPPQKSQQIGQTVSQKEGRGAQEQKIAHSAQPHPQHEIDPHYPIPRRHGVSKQGCHRQRPVGKIQGVPQKPQGDAAPDQAEQVIYQPQDSPQGHGAQKGHPLARDRDPHGSPQQAGEKTSPAPAVLLVGEGLHHPLHLQIAPVQTQLLNMEPLPPDDKIGRASWRERVY